jgi:hypothetical protein
MSRLQSLQSSSSSSPSRHTRASPPPSSPSTVPYPQDTTTYHRKLRALLNEVRSSMGVWDELVGDGWKASKGLIDEGTEIECVYSGHVSCYSVELTIIPIPQQHSRTSRRTIATSNNAALHGVPITRLFVRVYELQTSKSIAHPHHVHQLTPFTYSKSSSRNSVC